jgi:uncharacterized protein YbjT (DUF2867 family)/uncharacterized membrane protein YphA (DoxX/SURF4 family)
VKVLVVGSTGFIGSHLVAALTAAGHLVRCASREPAETSACAEHVTMDYTQPLKAEALRTAVAGCQVVINAVGILRERGTQTFASLHDAGPRALFTACAAAGIARVIQISALGSYADAPSRYHRSKHAADRHLMDNPTDWAIVQPSLVYGAGGSSAKLFDLLASLPVTFLPAGGTQRVQPVFIDDLVAAVLRLVESPTALRCVLPVVGPEPMTLREFLGQLRTALGFGPARQMALPKAVIALAARIGDRLPGSLLDTETLGMLDRGNVGDPGELTRLLGRSPVPVSAFVTPADRPSRRTAAAMSWLLPLLRFAVAAMWFLAAIVSMGPYPVPESLALLRSIGAPPGAAPLLLVGAVALNFTFGVCSLLPRRPRWLWSAQIALVLAYTAIISWKLPALWLEPFGPVAKNIPILALLLLLRQLDRRP